MFQGIKTENLHGFHGCMVLNYDSWDFKCVNLGLPKESKDFRHEETNIGDFGINLGSTHPYPGFQSPPGFFPDF